VLSVIVLIVGASGFIGSRLVQAFSAQGHTVICGTRRIPERPSPGCTRHIALDYTALPSPEALRDALAGVEVVVNAVGILRSRGGQTLESLHDAGPRALFAACAAAGVRRVIQISALGADHDATALYHRSKHAADRYLMQQSLDWAVVQPSLVYGAGGTSARLFDLMASLPVIPLPGRGQQRVQPVHIDDLVQAVMKLAESPASLRLVLPVVGPWPLTLRNFLLALRVSLGLPAGRTVSVPTPLVKMGALAGEALPGLLLDRETLGMLERGNVADPEGLTEWLGRRPVPVEQFVSPARRESRRVAASLSWLLPLLRGSLAITWLIAAIVSAGPYPRSASIDLLVGIGIPSFLAPATLWIAIGIDLLFGVMTLSPRRPSWLWNAQIAVVLGYTAIISLRLPALWLEPFGPVAKNLPILAVLLMLRQLDRSR
jgi:uncharacterized protein YbjT (DUF2867 family)